jgi:hypothetical protein
VSGEVEEEEVNGEVNGEVSGEVSGGEVKKKNGASVFLGHKCFPVSILENK